MDYDKVLVKALQDELERLRKALVDVLVVYETPKHSLTEKALLMKDIASSALNLRTGSPNAERS